MWKTDTLTFFYYHLLLFTNNLYDGRAKQIRNFTKKNILEKMFSKKLVEVYILKYCYYCNIKLCESQKSLFNTLLLYISYIWYELKFSELNIISLINYKTL